MKLFVYGSLLDPASAERALHRALSQADLLTVRLPGYRLSWDSIHRIHAEALGRDVDASFLNLEPAGNGCCVGAIIAICNEELNRLIQREKDYQLLELNCIDEAGQPHQAISFIDQRRPPQPLPPAPAAYLAKIRRGLAKLDPAFVEAWEAALPPPPHPLLEGADHFVDAGQKAHT